MCYLLAFQAFILQSKQHLWPQLLAHQGIHSFKADLKGMNFYFSTVMLLLWLLDWFQWMAEQQTVAFWKCSAWRGFFPCCLLTPADAASSAALLNTAGNVLFQRCLPKLNGFPLSNSKGFFQTLHGLIFSKGKVMQILSNGRRIKRLKWPSWGTAAPTELVSSGFSSVIDSSKISMVFILCLLQGQAGLVGFLTRDWAQTFTLLKPYLGFRVRIMFAGPLNIS